MLDPIRAAAALQFVRVPYCNQCMHFKSPLLLLFSGLLKEAAVGGILLVKTFHFCSVLRDGNLLKIKIKLVEHYALNKNM
jgi:hypothetical protein